jgi:hypothetical protein
VHTEGLLGPASIVRNEPPCAEGAAFDRCAAVSEGFAGKAAQANLDPVGFDAHDHHMRVYETGRESRVHGAGPQATHLRHFAGLAADQEAPRPFVIGGPAGNGRAATLDAGDGLKAALHTPAWVRGHLDKGRLLLLYHRDDFVQGDWPLTPRDGLAEQARLGEARLRKFARDTFGRAGPGEIRRAQFVLSEVPVAAVGQYLQRRERPPPIVDELIRTSYRAVVDGYRRVIHP